METVITATEANRSFAAILRGIAAGNVYAITSHGRIVARLVPPTEGDDSEIRDLLWEEHLNELENRPIQNIGKWTRDELYDDH